MSGLGQEDRERLRDLVDDLPPDDGEPFLFTAVEQIIARHIEAFREQAVVAIEAQHRPGITVATGDALHNDALHEAARIVRGLPR